MSRDTEIVCDSFSSASDRIACLSEPDDKEILGLGERASNSRDTGRRQNDIFSLIRYVME